MRFLYTCLIRCAVPFAYLTVLWRGFGDRGYWRGLGERLGMGRNLRAPSIWLHAVSLGEMTAAAPLLRALRARYPLLPLVVTTATPAGRARAESLLGNDTEVRFLPYDTPGSVRRFLVRVQPRVGIIMETELWPNLLCACHRRGIPVLLASARLSAKSVPNYRRFGNLFRDVFTPNLTVAAQTSEDAERFRALGAGAEQLSVVGNVKFDLELDADVSAAGRALRGVLGAARPVWTAGSTHEGEEQQLLEAHALLRKSHPDALLLLVPRHKNRFDPVADLLARRGVDFARRSAIATTARLSAGVSVVLGDTVGELTVLYAAAEVAFVGGSLVPIGGHNLLEPAALGLPVLTGPSHSNGREIAQLLLTRGAALQVNSAEDLAHVLRRLIENPGERERMGRTGQEIVAANRGSLAKLLGLVGALLGASCAS
jgi:3-deoxy-D-manno-octulosonic-acid transferase